MAKFEHKRYPSLVLQDEHGIWATFSPETREFGENKIQIGVLETSDPELGRRLAACPDPDLICVDATGLAEDDENMPDGPIPAVLAWVGDDLERAQQALDAEQAKGESGRKGVIDPLTDLLTRPA